MKFCLMSIIGKEPIGAGSRRSARLSHVEAARALVTVRDAAEEEVDRCLVEHPLGLVRVTRVAVLALRAGVHSVVEQVVGSARRRTER